MGETKLLIAGQNQIIAKTLLCMCGIYTLLTILLQSFMLNNIVFEGRSYWEIVVGILTIIVFISVICSIIYFLIIENNWLVMKILPEEEAVGNPKKWFTASLRVGLVFLGLILFAKGMDKNLSIVYSLAKLPSQCRDLITNIIQGNRIFADRVNFYEICHVLRLIIVVYLIAGAPHFIKWQLKRNSTIENLDLEVKK
jgi:hypothetical protein